MSSAWKPFPFLTLYPPILLVLGGGVGGVSLKAISSGKHPLTPKSQQGLPMIFPHDILPLSLGTTAVRYYVFI